MSRCISYWFENGEFSIQSCEFSGLQHIQPTNHQGGDGQILAVYDLGGGTFDISILEIPVAYLEPQNDLKPDIWLDLKFLAPPLKLTY